MCELLGMSANVPTDICFSFTGLIRRSGATGPHKDGWGIAFYEGKGVRIFRDPKPGVHSSIANFVQNYPIKSCIAISHIRRANRGRVCLENTHPFTRELWGKNWTFAHNGQLHGIKKFPLKFYRPVGTTDSEHAFCWIMDQVRERFRKRPPSTNVLNAFISGLFAKLDQLGKFNVLLSDDQMLYAYCSTSLFWITRKSPFCKASLVDAEVQIDFQKETSSNDVVTIIATQPLTTNEEWQKMVKGEIRVLRQGVFINVDSH